MQLPRNVENNQERPNQLPFAQRVIFRNSLVSSGDVLTSVLRLHLHHVTEVRAFDGQPGTRHLRGALGGAVVVRAAVRVLRFALGDGLHGRVVQPAADAVAAAAGRGGGPGAAHPGRG